VPPPPPSPNKSPASNRKSSGIMEFIFWQQISEGSSVDVIVDYLLCIYERIMAPQILFIIMLRLVAICPVFAETGKSNECVDPGSMSPAFFENGKTLNCADPASISAFKNAVLKSFGTTKKAMKWANDWSGYICGDVAMKAGFIKPLPRRSLCYIFPPYRLGLTHEQNMETFRDFFSKTLPISPEQSRMLAEKYVAVTFSRSLAKQTQHMRSSGRR